MRMLDLYAKMEGSTCAIRPAYILFVVAKEKREEMKKLCSLLPMLFQELGLLCDFEVALDCDVDLTVDKYDLIFTTRKGCSLEGLFTENAPIILLK